VAAAIGLADEQGAEALTMKAVAHRLGPYTPMALYRYVSHKDGLVDLMLDTAMAEVRVPESAGTDWREDLRALAVDTRAMITRHPWYARLAHTRAPLGPNLMRRLEFLLTVLTAQGATISAAMTYAALIDRHIIGSGLQEAEETRLRHRTGLADDAAFVAAITALRDLAEESGRYPLLTRWFGDPGGATPDERFDLGLTFLLDGIASRLAAG